MGTIRDATLTGQETDMGDFSYVRARSLAEALALLSEPGLRSRVLAGGTDLVIQLRNGEAACERVVDVTHLPELRGIEVDGRITIGAAVTHREIVESATIQRLVPFLAHACSQIGSPQIRNVGTIGGNVANAAACADTLPVLACLDAAAIIDTLDGEHRMPVSELVTGAHQTCLPQGALIRTVVFDPPPQPERTAYLRVGRRRAMAIARLSVAAMAALDAEGRIALARIVPGATSPRFRCAASVGEMLVGQQPAPALFVEAGRRMAELFSIESGSRWSAPYKGPALAALTERALREVLAG